VTPDRRLFLHTRRRDGGQALLQGLVVLAELLALGVKLEDAALLPARGVVKHQADGLLELVKDRGHARDLLVPAIVDELYQATAAGGLTMLEEAGECAGQGGP
jgi:hypothetical protein